MSRKSTRAKPPFSFHRVQPHDWKKDRLEGVLEGFSRKKILVVGDVGIDRYVEGLVERISPEAPVPVVLVESETLKLGLAANVADNIKALGGTPFVTGVVGKDRAAEDFRKLLRSRKIASNHLVTDPKRRTVLKERVVSERQQLLRIDYETSGEISSKVENDLIRQVKSLIEQCDAVILEDYAKGLMSQRVYLEAFRHATRRGKITAVDPNRKTPVGFYRGATLLTPNTKEAEELSGIQIRDEESLVAAGQALLSKTAARYVIITRGKDGMAIFGRGRKKGTIIPTYAREVYDVSGAGDTVISVLTLALAAGASVEDSAILGNLAAGIEVAKRGTATVSRDEIIAAMDVFEAIGV